MRLRIAPLFTLLALPFLAAADDAPRIMRASEGFLGVDIGHQLALQEDIHLGVNGRYLSLPAMTRTAGRGYIHCRIDSDQIELSRGLYLITDANPEDQTIEGNLVSAPEIRGRTTLRAVQIDWGFRRMDHPALLVLNCRWHLENVPIFSAISSRSPRAEEIRALFDYRFYFRTANSASLDLVNELRSAPTSSEGSAEMEWSFSSPF